MLSLDTNSELFWRYFPIKSVPNETMKAKIKGFKSSSSAGYVCLNAHCELGSVHDGSKTLQDETAEKDAIPE